LVSWLQQFFKMDMYFETEGVSSFWRKTVLNVVRVRTCILNYVPYRRKGLKKESEVQM